MRTHQYLAGGVAVSVSCTDALSHADALLHAIEVMAEVHEELAAKEDVDFQKSAPRISRFLERGKGA